MGTLDFDFASDMDDIFLDSGFEEDITYTPDGETALSIKAIVDRSSLDETVEGANRLNIYKYQIIISKTDVPNAVREGDEVIITVGDSTEILRVGGILEDDLGAYRLGLK